jgi:hypothetical protein
LNALNGQGFKTWLPILKKNLSSKIERETEPKTRPSTVEYLPPSFTFLICLQEPSYGMQIMFMHILAHDGN